VKIYVDLLDEMVAVWCPVEAELVGGDVYEIVEINGDPVDTRWHLIRVRKFAANRH
jgi:hypothetical protein